MRNERTAPRPAEMPAYSGKDAAESLPKQSGQPRESFSALYQSFYQGIYRYHLARTGQIEDAQDLTSQTFLAALEGLASFRAHGRMSSWLFAIARHKLVDYYRSERPQLALDQAAHLADSAEDPEKNIQSRLELHEVAQALQQLADERAEALALRFFAGLSAAEIAQVMHKSEAAVKMLVHRALGDLRMRLAHRLEMKP